MVVVLILRRWDWVTHTHTHTHTPRWDKIPTLADFFKAPLNYYAHNAAFHMYSMHTTVIKVTCSVLHIDLVPVWLSAVNSDLPRVMDI